MGKRKTLIASLLLAVLLTCCAPATATIPSTMEPISTPIAIPTATISIRPSQIPSTQQAEMLIEPYQDVRSQNLSKFNKSLGESLIKTLWFDQSTIWFGQDRQIAQNILELGMNPGLGVRALHAEGITGKGVTVAIIDQPVILEHSEFEGKIVKYRDMGTGEASDQGSMHGPAVTSLLVGEHIGTAPGANIYYVAIPSWLLDAQYYADALEWIIEENEKLPQGSKIRAVSVSATPSGIWSETKNAEAWDAAYQRATEVGILVLDCSYENGITVPCTYDLHDPDNVAKCIPNWTGLTDSPHVRLNIPTSRTTATEVVNMHVGFSYQYTGRGGLSWTTPYLAGVLAMGWQINPNLMGSQLLDMLYSTAYEIDGSTGVIDPRGFIEVVGQTVEK